MKINNVNDSLIISEQTLQSAASSITFSSLDGIAHGGYNLEVQSPSGGSGFNTHFCLFVNGDHTLNNYTSLSTVNVNGTVYYNNIAQKAQIGGCYGNDTYSQGISSIYVKIGIVNSRVTFWAECFAIIGTGSIVPHSVINIYQYIPTVTNLTSLVIQGFTRDTTNENTNGLPTGLIATLFRKK